VSSALAAAAVALAMFTACDAGEKRAASPSGSARSVPPGPYVVRYECFHSMQPWGKGWSRQTYTTDLAAKTRSTLLEESKGDEMDKPPPPPGEQPPVPPAPTISPLAAERIAPIEAAIEKILRGGPYKQENAVPEGISCDLTIEAAGKKLFSIDKSLHEIKDDVEALLQELSR
jgi:hypothetical protein